MVANLINYFCFQVWEMYNHLNNVKLIVTEKLLSLHE